MTMPLSGPLATRRLGTRSGDLRSLARRTNDPKAKSALVVAAAQAKMDEPSAITSAEGNLAERNLALRQNAGLMESRRRQQFGTTTPVAGAGDATAPKTPSLLDRKGVTSSGAGGNPAAPVPTTNADGLVSAPAMSSPEVAPLREGRIDGMPASQATAQSRSVMAAGGPREQFGRSLAERNLGPEVTNDSFRTALADYNRRAAADDPIARAGRGDAYVAATAKPGEPEMATRVMGAPAPGPVEIAARNTREAVAGMKTPEQRAADIRLAEVGIAGRTAPKGYSTDKPLDFENYGRDKQSRDARASRDTVVDDIAEAKSWSEGIKKGIDAAGQEGSPLSAARLRAKQAYLDNTIRNARRDTPQAKVYETSQGEGIDIIESSGSTSRSPGSRKKLKNLLAERAVGSPTLQKRYIR